MSIYKKIANIQDQILNIPKDGKNPHFSNTYATYEQVMEVLHPLLRKEELMICHSFDKPLNDGQIAVTTMIVDASGDEADKMISSTLYIPMTKNDPQMAGSAITYAKRYSVLAMLGLGTEDDDGEKATARPTASPKPTTEPTKDYTFNNVGALEEPFEGEVPCKQCNGKTTYKEFTSKAGNFVKGYFCNGNSDHKPFFVK